MLIIQELEGCMNTPSTFTGNFHLFLLFPSGLPIIRKMPPISAVAGEPLVVTCPAAGFPIHAVTWEKGKNI
jgi:hypothetical protein